VVASSAASTNVRGIAGSVFVDIPECGHMCTLERPDAVNAALRKWFLSVIASEQARGNAANSARVSCAPASARK
jgi:hypothetical protein